MSLLQVLRRADFAWAGGFYGMRLRLRPDNAAGHCRAGVSGGLGCEVVWPFRDDDSAPPNACGRVVQRQAGHACLEACRAVLACGEHGQVAQMVRGAGRAAVACAGWIEVAARISCGGATAVASLVDMQAVGAWRKTGEGALDQHLISLLAKGHEPAGLIALGGFESCLEACGAAEVRGKAAAAQEQGQAKWQQEGESAFQHGGSRS